MSFVPILAAPPRQRQADEEQVAAAILVNMASTQTVDAQTNSDKNGKQCVTCLCDSIFMRFFFSSLETSTQLLSGGRVNRPGQSFGLSMSLLFLVALRIDGDLGDLALETLPLPHGGAGTSRRTLNRQPLPYGRRAALKKSIERPLDLLLRFFVSNRVS